MSLRKTAALVAFLFATLMSSLSFAADNSAVLGKWNIELSFQGQSVNIDLTINQGQNGLEGTWAGPQGATPLSDVSYEGDTLTFTRTGQQGPMTMSFKVAGDTISGNLTTPGGDLPVTGKKSG